MGKLNLLNEAHGLIERNEVNGKIMILNNYSTNSKNVKLCHM
jgi:hypothetical protein